MKKIALLTLLSASALPAMAAPPAFTNNLYLVASVGESRADLDKGDIDSALASAGATGISSHVDKTDTAYKLQVGYQFTPNIAVEGGYVDLGKFKYNATVTGGAANAEAKAKGWNIDLVGSLPLGDAFSVFGKIGAIYAKVEDRISASGAGGAANVSSDNQDWKATWGVGAAYHFNPQMAVRLEYEQFNDLGENGTTGKADVRLISAGLVFKF